MNRLLVALVALALLAPHVGAGPGPGYFASDNVEWLGNVGGHVDAVGARIVGKRLYLTTERDLTIYDISNAGEPRRIGGAAIFPPQEFYFPEEDVDTNGKILLTGRLGTLYVVDVSDPSNIRVVGQVEGADEHTVSCILDCTYAYGSGGVIVDLRDPSNPDIVGNWSKGLPGSDGHDVTEVAPGLVVTSTQPIMFLDARRDPVHPQLLALGKNKDERFIHGNLWPNRATDRFLLAGGESLGPRCEDESDGAFMTWDTRVWKRTHTFTMVDEYRVKNGLPVNGDAAVDLFCAHWFDTHPRYDDGGFVAIGWYEHGTRFLKVTSSGEIKPVGYFLPVGGSTSAAYWINDEIVYAVDYNRGLDILRFSTSE